MKLKFKIFILKLWKIHYNFDLKIYLYYFDVIIGILNYFVILFLISDLSILE